MSHLLVWCCLSTAQEATVASAPPATASNAGSTAEAPATTPVAGNPSPKASTAQPASEGEASAQVEETRPAIFYLPDKQGKLQPVLDFNYQDFVDLYRWKHQLERREQPPRYCIQRMSIRGNAESERARLTVQFQILVRDDDWVRIPLRLTQGLLCSEVQHNGPGEQFVQFAPEDDGYACWIRGKGDTQHEVTLTLLVPLQQIGEETRLKLHLPRSTASELKLTVPAAEIAAKVSDGATLLPPVESANKPSEGKQDAAASAVSPTPTTELVVVGLGGEFQLAWHKANPKNVETSAVIESVASISTHLDSRSITSDAILSVKSYGGPFDRLVVRLPPGAELNAGMRVHPVNAGVGGNGAAAGNPAGCTIAPMPSEHKDPGSCQLAEVRLARKTTGPVDIHLSATRPYDPAANSGWCELSGFEVVDAARQWGAVAVAASNEWQVLWGPNREVHQVDPIPESLRQSDAVACFEYAQQPFSLTVRLTPRRTRVTVEPEYALSVDRHEVALEGRLTYKIRGAGVASLEIAMPGWELREVGPEGLVAVDGVTLTPEGVATIPLLQPMSGEVELRLRARRAIPTDAKSLAVPLPQPRNCVASPGATAVVSADNVEIVPNPTACEGLTRQRTAPSIRLPERQQEPLFYRAANGAVFAADLRFHSQRIGVEVGSELTASERTVEVEQRFAYQIAYEPVDHLTIAAPRVLGKAGHLQFLFDGKPLQPAMDTDRPYDRLSATIPLRVTLPQPQIGLCELVVRYVEPVPEPSGDSPTSMTIPLPMPSDGDVSANRASIKAVGRVQASPRPGVWTSVESENTKSGRPRRMLLTAFGRVGEIGIEIASREVAGIQETFVDRAWMQTWLSHSARQDRVVFQIVTSQKHLDVAVPPGVAVRQMSVSLDGKQTEHQTLGDNRLRIPLLDDGETYRYVLELRYHFSDPRPPRGPLSLQFPRLGADVWVRRAYWELALPPNEHMVADPAGFTGENHWCWKSYFWGRQPLLSQGELESWVGAAPRSPLPESCNTYLYSGAGRLDRVEVRTISRSLIVLFASGAALVLGLLLIYVPAGRHPVTLLVLALTLFGAAFVSPDATFLVAQAASLGVLLALATGALNRILARRHSQPRIAEVPNSRVEVGSTRTPYRPAIPAVREFSTPEVPGDLPPVVGSPIGGEPLLDAAPTTATVAPPDENKTAAGSAMPTDSCPPSQTNPTSTRTAPALPPSEKRDAEA
jgi:hypothetical protein